MQSKHPTSGLFSCLVHSVLIPVCAPLINLHPPPPPPPLLQKHCLTETSGLYHVERQSCPRCIIVMLFAFCFAFTLLMAHVEFTYICSYRCKCAGPGQGYNHHCRGTCSCQLCWYISESSLPLRQHTHQYLGTVSTIFIYVCGIQ